MSTALQSGARLGPYEIVALLGVGGMGEVYRARDVRLGREVAVKVLPTEVARDAGRLRRFELEARATAALDHPNILAIHDVGDCEGQPFLVSELLEGKTLRQSLEDGPLPIPRAVEYARQIAVGLSAAHAKNLVHRDLKPENVFVTTDGRVKILDFGVAKLLHGAASPMMTTATGEDAIPGTVGYMAPERLRGHPADARSDIFALGVVLYEMLAGRPAFVGESAADILTAVLTADPEPLAQIGAHVPPSLGIIVGRCLEKAPATRFQSASDLSHALGAVGSDLRGNPDSPRSRVRQRSLWPFSRRGVALTVAAATVGAVLLLVLELASSRKRPLAPHTTRPVRLAVLPFANMTGREDQEYLCDGLTEAMIAELGRLSPAALSVIARTSMMHYLKTSKPITEIGRELNVDYLLESSLRSSGDRVQVTARLVRAEGATRLWTGEYERSLSDVLDVQRQIALAIAQEIEMTLTPSAQARLRMERRVNAAAYRNYLLGQYQLNKRTRDGITRGLKYFLEARRLDPGFAEAHAGSADAYLQEAVWGIVPYLEGYAKSEASAREASRIDPSLAEAHVILGQLDYMYKWEWSESDEEFRRALTLAPNLAAGHATYSEYLIAMRRGDDAVREIRRAMELDPLSIGVGQNAGYIFALAGRYDEALDQLRRTLELDPDNEVTHGYLGTVYSWKGEFNRALTEYRVAQKVSGHWTPYAGAIGHVLAKSGRAVEAREILNSLLAVRLREPVAAGTFAALYAALGQRDEAFEWLQKAVEERSCTALELENDHALDALRSDPRFARMRRQLGLEGKN